MLRSCDLGQPGNVSGGWKRRQHASVSLCSDCFDLAFFLKPVEHFSPIWLQFF